ncbi:MAG: hypothetical protein DHS20C20_23960 [Ardenticatenaceae bacterium]|nr:MAG: hypothetical protein DHS20C20_23960 [Ardenticatenaceae bacterium]
MQQWLVLLLLSFLVACGGNTEEARIQSSPTAKPPTPENTPTIIAMPNLDSNSGEEVAENTSTPTPQITPTVTLASNFVEVAVPITPPSLQGPLIAFDAVDAETGQDAILIVDTTTGLSREISSQQLGGTIVGFDWSANGCNLVVALHNSSNVQFVQTDLEGNIIASASQPIPRNTDVGSRYGWTMSSTQEWIAFLVGTGEDEEGFGFEFKDIWTVRNGEESATPIALTQNGYTPSPAWSPNGERLAFSNYDSAGILQLYHAASDGSDLIQLTHFSEPIARIQGVRWSPDGQWLTFAVYNTVNPLAPGESNLWSVNTNGHAQQQANLGEYIVRQPSWWSADSASYSAYVELWSTESSLGFQGGKIVWVNPQTGVVTDEFTPRGINFEHVFPVGGNNIIGFLGSAFTMYERKSESIISISESPFGPLYARTITPIIGPYDFPGESNCN